MQELINRLNNLQEEYAELEQRFTTMELTFGYASRDFFNLEPYHIQLKNYRLSDVKISASPDQVVGGNLVVIGMSKGVRFSREYLDEDTYYDSFFEHNEHSTTRIWCFVKDGIVDENIRSIERVFRSKTGQPLKFIEVTPSEYQQTTFSSSAEGLSGKRDFFNHQFAVTRTEQLEVHLPPNGGDPLAIYSTDENGEKTQLYDKTIAESDLSTLLELAKESLTKEIIEASQHETLTKKNIAALLLEYSDQYPFPPALGFLQTFELNASRENGEHPAFLSGAADFKLFSEYDKPPLKTHNYMLYSIICSRIENLREAENYDITEGDEEENSKQDEASESAEIIFNFYVNLCRRLRIELQQLPNLSLENDFYVYADSYHQQYKRDYLKAIWPAARFEQLEKAIQSYEEIRPIQ